MTDLAQRTALVTGGAAGIGLAIARALAAQGARVVIADIDAERGQAAADQLTNATFARADLAAPGGCKALVDAAGPIDILINNAGLQHVAPLTEFPEAKWRQLIEIMLTAPFLLTQAALPGMQFRRWGRIINIGSVHSLRASPFKSAYVAAKHGLLGLTRVTALEGAEFGITCNAICPSYVRTALVEKQIADQARVHHIPEAEVVERVMLTEAPIKRLLEPDEVAAMAAYLCGDFASGITGGALTIDCGWTAH